MSSESKKGISRHFRREAKLMAAFPIAVIALGVLAAIFVPKIVQFFRVDRCLDHGGSFNYQQNICEGAKPNG